MRHIHYFTLRLLICYWQAVFINVTGKSCVSACLFVHAWMVVKLLPEGRN